MRIGIDLGGTKTEAIVLAGDATEVWRKRVATVQGDYESTLRQLASLVTEAEQMVGCDSLPVGIGIPGTISRKTECVKNANSTWLIGRALQRDLSRALNRPVQVANDANCFALSESADGAGREFPTVFGVILGTGVGGGFVIDKKIHEGPNSIAGEWGHASLPWPEPSEQPGPKCYCGRLGCVETFLAGPSLVTDHLRSTGNEISSKDIVANFRRGEPSAKLTMARYFSRLARGLSMVINIFDPHAIVLGGGMSNIDEIYLEIPKLWCKSVFSDSVSTTLLKAKHGDSSGVRGAAWLNKITQ